MKTIEERVQILEANFASLQEAFLQSQSNQANTQGQIDNTTNKVDRIEPTTYTKTVGIGETEVTFTDIANGNISVFIEDNEGNFPTFDMDKSGNILTVYFEPLENVATITVSII